MLYPPWKDAVPLERSVCRSASILLGELVAILIALEHFLQCSDSLPSKLMKIFIYSQSAVGILTLNWKDTSYTDATKDSRQATKSLREKGVTVDRYWTPGHATIAGNEVTDKPAKKAAIEASQRSDDKRYTTFQEIKEVKTQTTRWQTKWDTTEWGRTYHSFVPSVDRKRVFDIPDRNGFCNILQLQTGFSKLKDYRHKLGRCENNRCQCGELQL